MQRIPAENFQFGLIHAARVAVAPIVELTGVPLWPDPDSGRQAFQLPRHADAAKPHLSDFSGFLDQDFGGTDGPEVA